MRGSIWTHWGGVSRLCIMETVQKTRERETERLRDRSGKRMAASYAAGVIDRGCVRQHAYVRHRAFSQ